MSEFKKEAQTSSNTRPIRNRKKPVALGIIQALIPMLAIIMVMAEPPITEGIYFAKQPSTIFTDSEWILTTELTFTDAFKTIRSLRAYLYNRVWNQTFTAGENHPAYYDVHVEPTPIQVILTHYAQTRTNDTLQVLEVISQRLNDVVGTMGIKPPTKPTTSKNRGLINLGGNALKWLFGTPNNNDLEKINQTLFELQEHGVEIVHSIESGHHDC